MADTAACAPSVPSAAPQASSAGPEAPLLPRENAPLSSGTDSAAAAAEYSGAVSAGLGEGESPLGISPVVTRRGAPVPSGPIAADLAPLPP